MKKSPIALALLMATSPVALAQEAEQDTDAETMIVTANRTAEQAFNVLAAVDVFDRIDIEKIQPRSLSDLLSRVAGITSTTNGTEGSASFFVRSWQQQ